MGDAPDVVEFLLDAPVEPKGAAAIPQRAHATAMALETCAPRTLTTALAITKRQKGLTSIWHRLFNLMSSSVCGAKPEYGIHTYLILRQLTPRHARAPGSAQKHPWPPQPLIYLCSRNRESF